MSKKTAIVVPAYNAEKTILPTLQSIPEACEIIIVDDGSQDATREIICRYNSNQLILTHSVNQGYGSAQKTGIKYALEKGADIIVILHGDNQYPGGYIPALIKKIEAGTAIVLGSRIKAGKKPKEMPLSRYLINRALTTLQNIRYSGKFTDLHTGLRAYSAGFLKSINLDRLSDDFIFDNELLTIGMMHNFKIDEIDIPTSYHEYRSSINYWDGFIYTLGVVALTVNPSKMVNPRN